MRYYQIILESKYIEELKDEIINMLSMATSHGFKKIKTSMLIKDLKTMGYDVDEKSIIPLLDQIDMIVSADSNFIEINGQDQDSDDFDDEMEIPKFDQKPLDDLDTQEDSIDRIARKRSTEDL
jgi:hypothetical protein